MPDDAPILDRLWQAFAADLTARGFTQPGHVEMVRIAFFAGVAALFAELWLTAEREVHPDIKMEHFQTIARELHALDLLRRRPRGPQGVM